MRNHTILKVTCLFLICLWATQTVLLDLQMARSRLVPPGWDFVQHYAASALTAEGRAKDVYDFAALAKSEEAAAGFGIELYPYLLVWNYPPTFLLAVAPLSLFPYTISLLLWLGLTSLLYFLLVYRIVPHELTIWLALAFPAAFWTFLHGQNSFLIASFLGGGLLILESHPITAGFLLACGTIKPHLFLAIPFALVAGRRWKALLSTAATALSLVIVSWLLYGPETWSAFWEHTVFLREILEAGHAPYNQMPTPYSSARMMGLDPRAAMAAQILISLAAVALVCIAWRLRQSADLQKATLLGVACLVTPYLLTHDLTVLGLALAFFAREALASRRSWTSSTRIIWALTWSLPIYCVFVAQYVHVQIAPYVIMVFVSLAFVRLYNSPSPLPNRMLEGSGGLNCRSGAGAPLVSTPAKDRS